MSTDPVSGESGKGENLRKGAERWLTSILKILSSGPVTASFPSPGRTHLNKPRAFHEATSHYAEFPHVEHRP